MPDLWIDDHLGDEALARPDFKADLRASLAKDLGRRHAPWGTIAWAAAAVAAIVAIAVGVGTTRDHNDTVSPAPSAIDAAAITDRTWYVVSDNGAPVANVDGPATFTLRTDGRYTGSDGCNDYGSSIDPSVPKSGWTIEGATLHIVGTLESTAVGCLFATAMPLRDGSTLSLSDDGTTVTLTSDRTYVATTTPPLTGRALADRLVGVKWYITSVQGELTPPVAWVDLRPDGSVGGFNGGCSTFDGSWSLDDNELTVSPVTISGACLAGDKPDIIPLTGNTSRISIDGTGRGLTIANEQVYTAIADDATSPSTSTTAPFVDGSALETAIADRQWFIITDNGEMVQNSVSFVLHADHTVTGNDGCGDYGTDPAAADGWSLNGRLLTVPALTSPPTCLNVPSLIPLTNGSVLSLDATGKRLTITGDHTYFASTDPVRDRVVDKRWYVMVHDNEGVPVNAWFELHDDGTFTGFDGCNDYGSSVDSGWTIDGDLLRVHGTVTADQADCNFAPLQPVADGTTLGFEESFDAIYMEHGSEQFTVVLTQQVDPTSSTTTVPAAPELTPDDRASLLAAALLDRARVHNSFGPGGLPAQDVVVIDSVGALSAEGVRDPTAVPFTDAERAAIEAAFAPHAVTFVSFAEVVYPLDGGKLPVLQVGSPGVIDGQLTVASQVNCGGTCGAGGAIAAIHNPDGSWTMGDPVGSQFVA